MKNISKNGPLIISDKIKISTKPDCDIVDITEKVTKFIKGSGMAEGTLTVFCPGATGALTTMEYEPGCIADMKAWFSKHVPEGDYEHHKYHQDGNGHSHLRASLVGPSITVPFSGGSPILGMWQSIVFIDFDIHHRSRELVMQLTGI